MTTTPDLGTTTPPTAPPRPTKKAAPRKTTAARPADDGVDATAPRPPRSKLGKFVRFATTDPISLAPITGHGIVVEDEDGQVLVAPLQALGIRIPHEQLTDAAG